MGKELSKTHHKSPFCGSMSEKELPSLYYLLRLRNSPPPPSLTLKYLLIYEVNKHTFVKNMSFFNYIADLMD